MDGVILAAGLGSRLSPIAEGTHKLLLNVFGRAVIDFTVDALIAAGVTGLVVVLGHMSNEIRGHFVSRGLGVPTRFVYAPEYLRGNAASLYSTRKLIGDQPFLLAMGDHLISPSLPAGLLSEWNRRDNTLGVDHSPAIRDVQEATKVWVTREGIVARIGKGLRRWNGVDTGVFIFNTEIFEAVGGLISTPLRGGVTITRALRVLTRKGTPLRALDVTGAFWHDVDTPEDLIHARGLLGARGD